MPDSSRLIHRITPKNILSFGPECSGIELGSLNLLIGPNGSGKSNLIDVIDFIRASAKDLSEVVRRGGGNQNWIWKGDANKRGEVECFIANPWIERCLRHLIQIAGGFSQQMTVLAELIEDSERDLAQEMPHYSAIGSKEPTLTKFDGIKFRSSKLKIKPDPNRSILSQFADPNYEELYFLTHTYLKVRIYRDWSFGRKTVFRVPQPADMRRDRLEEDFSNLGLFLNRLKTEFPAAKRTLLSALQDLYEGITDFEVNTNGGTVQVFLHEGDFAIPATRLSDGTLRYLCLLAILCDPEPPPLICIEEPELGLHPDVLPGLADLMRSASERTQLIVTTHSDILVDAMTETPECVIVCEKHEGQTEMKRLDAAELGEWLQKYRLGQLWIDGQLGGKRW